jgi:hypothetical protein
MACSFGRIEPVPASKEKRVDWILSPAALVVVILHPDKE